MKIDQLIYFFETARQQHIGRASKVLAISPSAISHSISALEGELGRELFQKEGKRIFLTDNGKALAEEAEKLIYQIQQLKETFGSEKAELSGHYRMGAPHGLSALWLVPILSGLQRAYPKIVIELYSLRSAEIVSKIAVSELDFGICFSPQRHPRINIEFLRKDPLFIAVRKKHPILKFSEREQIRKISQFPCAAPKAFRGIDNCESHPIYKKFGIQPAISFIYDSYEVALH